MATVTTTVATITMLEVGGCLRRSRIDDQLKVPMETITITATSAAIGIRATQGPANTTRINSTTPATSVERRPRPPDFTLITDCPIIAQPAMPPRKPVATLAMPCPFASWFLSLGVSVRSSTICAVSIDSSRPTIARVTETGSTIISVSRFSGTSGSRNTGRLSGSSPMSPTVLMSSLSSSDTMVSTTIATSGEGTARVTRGSR